MILPSQPKTKIINNKCAWEVNILWHYATIINNYVIRKFKIKIRFVPNSIWWTVIRLIHTSDGFWTTRASTCCRRWIQTVSRWHARVNATVARAGTTRAASTWTETSRTTSNKTTREGNRKLMPSRNGRPRYSSCCLVVFTGAP